MSTAEHRLRDIHAMLAAGHRCVRLERHSLLLWGLLGGALIGGTHLVINDERFPDVIEQSIALLLWLSGWLGGAAWLDAHLTRRLRRRRDETLPFAQAQITRAWWMLLSVGVLGSFAMFFYGGGAMIYALWTVLLGLGIYLFGLFSRPLVEWIGLATILIGVLGLAADLPLVHTRWLAVSCFVIGLPLAGWLAMRVGDAGVVRRTVALLAWIAVVVGVPLSAAGLLSGGTSPTAVVVSLESFRVTTGEQVLRLAAGTSVPVRLDLDSPLLTATPGTELQLRLTMPLEVVLRDGLPDGRYRFGDDRWRSVDDGALRLRIDRLTPTLEDGVPVVRMHAVFESVEQRSDAR
ncbi:MAG: hypothetical protein RBT51_06450 [Ectothiorhodospiraceae bacterium]|nr:hypothetical protein [Ectothiorhodospiraceae bacterium]